MNVIALGQSDIGRVRKNNQDAWGLFSELGLHIVADGMGGRAAGEVASQMTVNLIHHFLIEAQRSGNLQKSPSDVLHDALCHANLKVFEASLANPAYQGMGTTVVLLWTDPFCASATSTIETAWIGFIGDSRVYRHREGTLAQITQDHSIVNEYIRMGVLTPEAARTHPQKHVLSRGIGVAATVVPEIFSISVAAGDLFLLCTDGLSNMLDHEAINAQINQKRQNLPELLEALIEEAKSNGGRDNITVVLVACT